jgi:hypothetical protein
MNITTLRTYIRDLTGIYSTDLLSNSLLDRWIQEAHTEVNELEDFPWRSNIVSGSLTKGSSTIVTPNDFSGRVKELVLVYPTNVIIQLVPRQGLISTDSEDEDYMYDVDYTTKDITLSQPLDTDLDYVLNYIKEVPAVDFVGTNFSVIPEQFQGVIAYRVAVKVLNSQADDSNRKELYAVEFSNMLDLMRIALIQEDDLGIIQLGGSALRIDKRTVGRQNLRFRSS